MSVIQVFAAGGLIFGWSSLQNVLRGEHAYRWLCGRSDGDGDCEAQTLRLNLVFTLGVASAQVASFFAGSLLDSRGPRTVTLVSGLCLVTGMLLLAYSSESFDAYIPGYMLLGFAAPGFLLSTFHIGNLFPGSEGLFIAIVNGAFDGSSIVFLLFDTARVNTGASLKTMAIIYCGIVGLFVFGVGLLAWPSAPYIAGAHRPQAKEVHAPVSGDGAVDCLVTLGSLPFGAQYRSHLFIGLVAFFSACFLQFNWFLATINDQLTKMAKGDDAKADLYRTIFSIVLPAGVFWCLLSGSVIDRAGLVSGFALCITMGVAVHAFLLSGVVEAQVASFVFFTIFRSLLFSVSSVCITTIFGFKNFGKLWGINVIFSGLFGSLQYALYALAGLFVDAQ